MGSANTSTDDPDMRISEPKTSDLYYPYYPHIRIFGYSYYPDIRISRIAES